MNYNNNMKDISQNSQNENNKEDPEALVHDEQYLDQLKQEIKEFELEKDRIRRVMGSFGGTKYSSRDNIINIILALLTISVFVLQFVFKFHYTLALELAVFLVSIKIILMIHAQHKHNHFMFWILNTIEYRINDTYKIIKKLEKKLEDKK